MPSLVEADSSRSVRTPCDIRAIFGRALSDSTSYSNVLPSFNPSSFFRIWFKEHGTALTFLFKKNLHVTNMQFAELVALLQSMTIDDSGKEVELQFVSPKEFSSTIRNLVDSFPFFSQADAEHTCSLIADLYSDLLRRVVVLSPHFGTCEVFLPANLSVELPSLCGCSGYIHSCGSNIYVRNATKASYDSLRKALKYYLESANLTKRIRLIVYSHEDFSPADHESGRHRELIHGLEECKIHLEKTYIGEYRLVSAIRKLREDAELAERIWIPESPRKESDGGSASDLDQSRSLFMVRDFSLGRHIGVKGEDVYLILYEQRYKNCNPFHYFDENKPAWIMHTTTPHTLIGAMINVTMPGWPDKPLICDPFVGTGTSLFELAKFRDAIGIGRDISPLSNIVIDDNRRIFSSPVPELLEMENFLKEGLDPQDRFPFTIKPSADFLTAHMNMRVAFFEFFARDGIVAVDLDDDEMSNEAALEKSLRIYSDNERLIFYLMLKTLRRNEGALHRGTLLEEWPERFRNEMRALAREVSDLARIYSKSVVKKIGNVLVVQDDYSLSCTINQEAWGADRIGIQDSRQSHVDSLEQDRYDVIIADPPYGFNTQRKAEGLAKLYSAMIPRMVGALKDGGQLVITLPERSYIGRRSPFFTHKEIVIQQILRAAQGVDLEVVKAAVPEPTSLFKPPYYWRSERALARSILHFRFRRSA